MAQLLIIEDDELILRMYQKIFVFEGFDVSVANNGQDGLDKIRAAKPKPALVMLDIMMPKMNGLEVLDKLKADPDTKTIPVVMLTNLAGQQDAESALAKGAVRYIIKSEHDPKEVTEIVKEILAGYTRNDIPESASSK